MAVVGTSAYTLEGTGKAGAVEKVTGSDDGDGDELEIVREVGAGYRKRRVLEW